MLDYILSFFAAILILTGVISILYIIFLYLLTPTKREPYVVFISLREDNNPISIVGAALEKRNICGETRFCEIIGIDTGLSEDTLRFLQDFYNTYDNFSILPYSDLDLIIKEKLVNSKAKDED